MSTSGCPRGSVSTKGFKGMGHTSLLEAPTARRVGERFQRPGAVVFVVNNDRSFLSHRASWASALAAAGSAVTVIAENTGEAHHIKSAGFDFIALNVGRDSSSKRQLVASAARIFFHLVRLRPSVVVLSASVAYTIGWPAAILLRKSRFVRVMGGVGAAFTEGRRQTLATRVVAISAKMAAKLPNESAIFQTEHDRQKFVSSGMARPETSHLVPGAGIDIGLWGPVSPSALGSNRPLVLFASRLYREKGVAEFVEASAFLDDLDCNFVVAGDIDAGVMNSISSEQLMAWKTAFPRVEFVGRVDDMLQILSRAAVLVFPSRHPEGTPRILLEAGACGVPSIVSNLPGCRAVISDGVNGVILADTEPSTIARSIRDLMNAPARRRQMAIRARDRIERNFSLEIVLERVLPIFGAEKADG